MSSLQKAKILLVPGKYEKLQILCFKFDAVIKRLNLNNQLKRLPNYDEEYVFYTTLFPEIKKELDKKNKDDPHLPSQIANKWMVKHASECKNFMTAFSKEKAVDPVRRFKYLSKELDTLF